MGARVDTRETTGAGVTDGGDAPRRVRLCILGFGNVARRLCEVLAARERDLVECFGLEIVVTAAGTRSHGSLVAAAGLSPAAALRAAGLEPGGLQTAPVTPAGWGFSEPARAGAELIAASGAEVLVEATVQEEGGAATAIAHVEDALARGMHVLSVNKGPIAWDYRRLADLAAAHGRRLLFEGVTMDGCPVYNLAARCLPGTRVLGISGVLNSTTNYLLDAMAEGRAFDEALAWVQAEGFAEADPSHDIDGVDAASKTAALANVLMDARLTPADVPRESIRAVGAERVAAVRAAGRRLRVVCAAEVVDGAERLPVLGAPHPAAPGSAAEVAETPAAAVEPPAVSATVRLIEVDADHPFFAVGGSMSTVVIRTDLMGEVQVVERDALLTQTAYALYGDLLSLPWGR
jgi:homoserine dehydrogenase